MIRIAVIIPMYNEEANAERCIRAVCASINGNVPGAQLFVVNDGSQDKTQEILQKLQGEGLSFSVVGYPKNRGYGGALMQGANAALEAGFEFGLFMDSDLTNDPKLIPLFVRKLEEGNYDLVKASRYCTGGGVLGVPLYKYIISRVGNGIASLLFDMGISDCTNGFHAVRLSLLSGLKFHETGFAWLLEELYHLKQRGARAAEIPYTLTSREKGAAKSKFSYSMSTCLTYLKYAIQARKLH